jgi:hypothetical protein
MIDRFEELLHSLGQIFHLGLHIDREHACSLRVRGDFIIQLQLDLSQENLWIFSKLIEVTPGRFRENVFQETLKANALADPRPGILGYIADTNHLALFQKYPLNLLNGERLAGLIGAFLEMGDAWRKAIAAGNPSPPSSTPPFGSK